MPIVHQRNDPLLVRLAVTVAPGGLFLAPPGETCARCGTADLRLLFDRSQRLAETMDGGVTRFDFVRLLP
jgi:hypothetical protein